MGYVAGKSRGGGRMTREDEARVLLERFLVLVKPLYLSPGLESLLTDVRAWLGQDRFGRKVDERRDEEAEGGAGGGAGVPGC